MRQGRVFKRCRKCGRTMETRRCSRCGDDRYSWAYQVDVAPVGAPRDQRLKSGFATKAEAVHAMNALQSAKAAGTHVEPSRTTVAGYLAEWLPSIDVRPGTRMVYGVVIRRYIEPRIGALPLQSLTTARVKAFYRELTETGRVRGGRPLSVKSVHNVHVLLRKALADAVRDQVISRNPADGAHRLPTDRGIEMKTWTADELTRFLASVQGDRNFALWRLAATTGMRRGELLGLRWEDLRLDAGQLSVRRQLVRGTDGFTYGPPKTEKGRRDVSLDDITAAVLRRHRKQQLEERLLMGEAYNDQGLVFARADGSPWDPDSITGTFERLSKRAGLPRIRLHDLRHTHASMALRAGVPAKVVQQRLGHASITITLDTYTHVAPDLDAEAARRVADLVDGDQIGRDVISS